MKEADQLAAWHPMCIYDNDTMIGFTMYGMILEPAYTRLWFDRLLIDKQHQGSYRRSAPTIPIQIFISACTQKTIRQSLYIAPLGLNLQANWIPKGKKS